ncbi:hypothetical protein [Clostridium coskatii]|uniref:Uncharacterized protein n=1 Tax=Clostridium coskatii TaxID=1705578 RepID=A0A162JBG7_9CLOT|nr:hypothetical protein [Clostridium coskatii]OAA93035.1 hypothetical protein WX73_00353 [Clostridium coskatii]OBR90778.1 hypothetical protein CLCOS_37530 [Clostridium coskatii]
MDDLKFKIVEVKKKPDVTTITAECLKDGEGVKANIPTMFMIDRDFVKIALKQSYLEQIGNSIKEGEII